MTVFAPIFLERSINNPIPHCTKNVPEWINTLIEVNDFPARFWGKLKAKAGCVKDKTIEDKNFLKELIDNPVFNNHTRSIFGEELLNEIKSYING